MAGFGGKVLKNEAWSWSVGSSMAIGMQSTNCTDSEAYKITKSKNTIIELIYFCDDIIFWVIILVADSVLVSSKTDS